VTPEGSSGSALVRFVARLPVSAPSSVSTPSSTELSASSTLETLSRTEPAMTTGSQSTERGSRPIRGDRYEVGRKIGANAVMQSPVIESLCGELSMLRKLVSAMTAAAMEQDKVICWYRGKLKEAYHHILTRRDP
jgi:hypothetical protein